MDASRPATRRRASWKAFPNRIWERVTESRVTGLLLNCSFANQETTDLTWLSQLQKLVASRVANQKGM